MLSPQLTLGNTQATNSNTMSISAVSRPINSHPMRWRSPSLMFLCNRQVLPLRTVDRDRARLSARHQRSF